MGAALIWSIVVGNLLVGTWAGIFQTPDKQNPLARFAWQKRVLILFTPVTSDPVGVTQLKRLNKWPQDLTDRDLEIVVVAGNKLERGEVPATAGPTLRREFNVPAPSFTMVLIGKDGGEKYRTQIAVEPGVIFNIIDAMPMRQSEMKRYK